VEQIELVNIFTNQAVDSANVQFRLASGRYLTVVLKREEGGATRIEAVCLLAELPDMSGLFPVRAPFQMGFVVNALHGVASALDELASLDTGDLAVNLDSYNGGLPTCDCARCKATKAARN